MLVNFLQRDDEFGFEPIAHLSFSNVFVTLLKGLLAYMLGFSLIGAILLQLSWEIFVNSQWGQQVTLKWFGRNFRDHSWKETMIDNLVYTIGWLVGYFWCVRYNSTDIMQSIIRHISR